MCIQGISENLFLCSRKPSSIATTTLLVITVAAAVLAGLAYHFQWGVPVMCSLASFAGLTFLVAMAIACCKNKCARLTEPSYERRTPYPSEIMPEVFKGAAVPENESRGSIIAKQLFELVQKKDLPSFKRAVGMYTEKDFSSLCMRSGCIMMPVKPSLGEESQVGSVGHTLFDLIFDIEDEKVRCDFLQVALTKCDGIDNASDPMIAKFLDIKDQKTIALLFSKMLNRLRLEVFDAVLDPKKEPNHLWYKAVIQLWKDRGEGDTRHMMSTICKSSLTPKEKSQLIAQVSGQSLEKVKVNTYLATPSSAFRSYDNLSILHFAIDVKAVDFVAYLCKNYPKLLNQPAQRGLTPLLQVLQMKNLKMLKILLKAGVNANVIIKEKEEAYTVRVYMQRGATQQTPLMIAACMREEGLYKALLAKGVDSTITDGSPEAWTAIDYYNH